MTPALHSSGTVTRLCSRCTRCGPAQVAGDNSCAGVLVRFSPVWLGRIHACAPYPKVGCFFTLNLLLLLFLHNILCIIIDANCHTREQTAGVGLGPISGLVDIPVYFVEGKVSFP